MRFSFVALVTVLAAGAQASFDLMLLPDQVTGRVLRYDPVNQVTLGSVPVILGVRSVAANNSTGGTGYAVTSTGAVHFNISTGERLHSAAVPNLDVSVSPDGTTLWECFSNSIFRYTSALVSTGSFSTGLTSLHSAQQLSATRLVAVGTNATGDLVALNYDVTTMTQVGSPVTLVAAASYFAGSITQGLARSSSTTAVITYRAADLTHRFMNLQTDLAGTVSSSSGNTIMSGFGTGTSASTCVVSGHTGVFVVGTNTAVTGASILEYAIPGSFSVTGSSFVSGVQLPNSGHWRAANVVAPEPASFLGMGLGMAALVRLRRRR